MTVTKNKVELKKYIKLSFIFILFFVLFSFFLTIIQYHIYTVNFNNKINSFVVSIKEKYPDISDNDIITIFNNTDNDTSNFFSKYGINLESESVINENVNILKVFIFINGFLMLLFSIILILIYLRYNKKKDDDIKEIENYIKNINMGNYKFSIDNNTEDELSILKNEVYKTMIMLKESANNSLNDKLSLKSSLEDISHQIKTPLTSIMIALDNLDDNPDLDLKTREKFIKTARKNTIHINFLIQSLLKLSKFDTNTIDFMRNNVSVNEIINEAISNTNNLCDLKNIKVSVSSSDDYFIYCDKYWQIEVITNIIKNAIEHAKSYVKIYVEENNAYLKIAIENDGSAISNQDLPHIFERFYKGKNASIDSVGIGLSLSKVIVENDNGLINVDSLDNGNTVFTIKYFKY